MDYKLIADVTADRDRIRRERDAMTLGILAEEGIHQVFGTRVQIIVSWPDGPPDGFADAEAVRQWARERLAELRRVSGDNR
jgi:hypothetical protein